MTIIAFTIILSAIYGLIRPYLDFAKRNDTNVDNVEQNDRDSFANKIVKYLEKKNKIKDISGYVPFFNRTIAIHWL